KDAPSSGPGSIKPCEMPVPPETGTQSRSCWRWQKRWRLQSSFRGKPLSSWLLSAQKKATVSAPYNVLGPVVSLMISRKHERSVETENREPTENWEPRTKNRTLPDMFHRT